MYRVRYYKCYFCSKYSDEIVVAHIDGEYRTICIKCFLAYALHETVKDMLRFGDEEELRNVVRVLEGINDLVEDHPLAQSIRTVVDEWANKYPEPLYVDELKQKWSYRFDLNKILDYLASEDILIKARLIGSDRIILSPGTTLKDLLKRFPSSRGFFRDVVKAVTGLAVIRYLTDTETRKFRAIYATLQAILACIEGGEREPVYEIKSYKCKLCEKIFPSRVEVKTHILKEHPYEIECSGENCIVNYIEVVAGKQLGEWCKLSFFIEKAGVYGVEGLNKFLRYLLTRGAIIPQEGNEVVVERGKEKYVAVDIAWIKVRERMRALERQLIRVG